MKSVCLWVGMMCALFWPLAAEGGPQELAADAMPHPLSASFGDTTVRAVLDLFTAYRTEQYTEESVPDLSEFRLERAHIGARITNRWLRTSVLLEAQHSAGGGAQMGVAGDSIIARFREASVGLQWHPWMVGEVGLIQGLLNEALLTDWNRVRPVGAPHAVREGLISPADLGARLLASFPHNYGEIGIAVVNGEGYTSRELNTGKDIETIARIRPLAAVDGAEKLEFLAGYAHGSRGSASTRANRSLLGARWVDTAWGLGFDWMGIKGLNLDGGREGSLFSGYLHAEPIASWILVGRASLFQRNQQDSSDSVTSIEGSIGWRVVNPATVYLCGEKTIPGQTTRTTNPEEDRWILRAILATRF